MRTKQKTIERPLDIPQEKQSEIYDELTLQSFMRYYGFQTRDELMKFLKNTCSDLG